MVVRRELAAALLVAALVAAAPLSPARAAGEDEALKQAAQAIKSGKGEAAIKFISNVLAVKGLPPALIAKGYYLRGLAYQKSGKPAQALADVSQALWLKQLSAGDAADAQKIRAAALGEVGKALPAGGPEKVAAAAAAVASEPAAAPAADGWSTEAVAATAEPVAKEPVAKDPVVAAAKPVETEGSRRTEWLDHRERRRTPGSRRADRRAGKCRRHRRLLLVAVFWKFAGAGDRELCASRQGRAGGGCRIGRMVTSTGDGPCRWRRCRHPVVAEGRQQWRQGAGQGRQGQAEGDREGRPGGRRRLAGRRGRAGSAGCRRGGRPAAGFRRRLLE